MKNGVWLMTMCSKWKVVLQMESEDRERLQKLVYFLKNFTSESALEILATVDFILVHHLHYQASEVVGAIRRWNERKKEVFTIENIQRAYEQLQYDKELLVRN